MRKKIQMHSIIIAAAAILSTLLLTLWVSYDMLREQVIEEIRSYAVLLSDMYDESYFDGESFEMIREDIRITVIHEDGTVVYDNYADIAQMDNHAQREEIQEALSLQEGYAIRNSDTLSESLYYYAVRTQDGTVVRVAKQASSVWGIWKRVFPLLVGIALDLFVLCVILARFMTIKLLAPIRELSEHMDHPETVAVYEELSPFVATIQKQHEDILRNVTMRQDFTANVSHELKTPLTSISGYAELMEHNMVDAGHITEFAGAIHKNADRLLVLINDIIRLSQLDSEQFRPEFETVDLYQLAQDCVAGLEMNAKKHNVAITVQGTTQRIRGNRGLIEELILNLCDNAIRYNKPSGTVEVNVYHGRKGIVLSVTDTGIGIAGEEQERIFERFYRVDKSRSKETGGTGLGLAIVKHIALIHEAALSLSSTPGEGTQIQVTFPGNDV